MATQALTVFVLCLCFCVCTQVAGQTLVLQATLYDQAPATMNHGKYPPNYWEYNGWTDAPKAGGCGTANGGNGFNASDFELPLWQYGTIRSPNAPGGMLYNGEKGLVGNVCNASNSWTNCGRIGADRKPVYQYPGHSPLYTVSGPNTFYDWFHATNQTKVMNINLTLTNVGGRTYEYSSDAFFPLDNKGWQDWNVDDNGTRHNFGFCLEIHSSFTYMGGETFFFSGDDDAWLYIDNRLVIDLGGVHTTQSASVEFDDIAGLVKGSNYRFDFFRCERHTTTSKFQIITSSQPMCTYYDKCGVCQGSGTSC